MKAKTKLGNWVGILSKSVNCLLTETSLSPLRKNVWQDDTATQHQTNGLIRHPQIQFCGEKMLSQLIVFCCATGRLNSLSLLLSLLSLLLFLISARTALFLQLNSDSFSL